MSGSFNVVADLCYMFVTMFVFNCAMEPQIINKVFHFDFEMYLRAASISYSMASF